MLAGRPDASVFRLHLNAVARFMLTIELSEQGGSTKLNTLELR
jgi:hypothetical protein